MWSFSCRNFDFILFFIIPFVHAQEGMWSFDALPLEMLEREYGIVLDEVWREHVQNASLRVNSWGSAAFVSSKGLFITNHHVGVLPSQERFVAEKGIQEIKCPEMYVDQLLSIREIGANETLLGWEEENGLHCEIISFYQNRRRYLYVYKRYQDIRLVMAPEAEVACFSEDPQEIPYPSCDLDFAFFRVYEEDKPVTVKQYLVWEEKVPCEGEVLFVAGNPIKTERNKSFYPDATFSLRLSVGTLQGYEEEGKYIAPITTLDAIFSSAEKKLPDYWLERKTLLDREIPLNFISTHDIAGGNSGSPVVNAAGGLVGIIFATNRYADDLVYLEGRARAMSVYIKGIIEILEKIYQAKALVEELGRKD